MTSSVTTTAAPSAECKLSVNVGDRQTDRQTTSLPKASFHYVAQVLNNGDNNEIY